MSAELPSWSFLDYCDSVVVAVDSVVVVDCSEPVEDVEDVVVVACSSNCQTPSV